MAPSMAPTVLRTPPGLPSMVSCGRGHIKPKAGARAKAKAGIAASAFAFEFEFEFDLSSSGYPAGERRRWNCLERWGAGATQNRRRHGPEACPGRVGQDAQPRSCRVRRTAHTSKAPTSLHGCIHSVFCVAPAPQRPHKTHRQLSNHPAASNKKGTTRKRRPPISSSRAAGDAIPVSWDQPARPPPWPRPRPPPLLLPPPRRWP